MRSCGYRFPVLSELDVVGGEYFEHDVCPVCDAHSRARLILQYLQHDSKALRGSEQRRVLHFAPERCISVFLASRPRLAYTAADLDSGRYGHVKAVPVDATCIPYPDDHFDLIICNHILEHIDDDRQAMRELQRVLRHGGEAILQVPISLRLATTYQDERVRSATEREHAYGQHDHVRLYGLDYPARLRAEGFVVEVIEPLARWGKPTVTAMGINAREKLFVCSKP